MHTRSTKQKQHKDIDSRWHCWTARPYTSAMVTSTSTPGSMVMEVICFTTSGELIRSITLLWMRNSNRSHVFVPDQQIRMWSVKFMTSQQKYGINIKLHSTCNGRAWWQSRRWAIYIRTLYLTKFFKNLKNEKGPWPLDKNVINNNLMVLILDKKVINNN